MADQKRNNPADFITVIPSQAGMTVFYIFTPTSH